MRIWREAVDQANRLLEKLWDKRYALGGGPSTNLLSLVKPHLIAQLLGLRYLELPEILDYRGQRYAGLMEPTTRTIAIAQRIAQKSIPRAFQRFTALHEVAHWVMHRNLKRRLFRDFPLSGAERLNEKRDPVERQADVFADYVLMPERQLRVDFQSYFGEPRLTGRPVDDDMRHWLSQGLEKPITLSSLSNLSRLELAELFAASWPWYGQRPESLYERYEVSRRAMAIQLIDLQLI
jgi:IrrE N-terminal-like domain